MTFDAAAFLAQHSSPEAALNALNAQYQEAQDGRDREGRAAQAARRERDTARSELDTAREELRTAQQQAAPEGAVVLTGDDAQFWTQQQAQGGREHLQARLTRAETADTLERTLAQQRAAAAYSVSEDDLGEWLAGRPLTSEVRKDAENKDTTVYGVTVQENGKDTFKPLSEFKTFTALTGDGKQQERPKIAAQRADGTPTAEKTVESRASELRGRISI